MIEAFREVWLADFEFRAPPGERPAPICLVARELYSDRLLRLWQDELDSPPFRTGPDTLFVAFYSSAELGCYLALDWPMPSRILDLFIEFSNLTCGLRTPHGRGLLGALAHFGLDSISAADKVEMRNLAMRGGPFTESERQDLLDYCQTDVDALAKLLPEMLPTIDWPRALLRGRYTAAAARIEWNGVPIDAETLVGLRENWSLIKSRLIRPIDKDYGCFVPTGKKLDPTTKLGAAVIRAADDHGLDPYQLLAAVDEVWAVDGSDGDRREAIQAARKATGLTINRITRWEQEGKDASTYPGLDVTARTLAGEIPALGIGRGYESGTNFDDTDHAGNLWSLLRSPDRRQQKYDPKIIDQAVELCRVIDDNWAPDKLSFNAERFAAYLIREGIPWQRTETGALHLDDDHFRDAVKAYPQLAPLRELLHALSELKLNDLTVGSDGRNRCLLSMFRSKTGRNQPSNSKFIFGPATWIRSLIRPAPGMALAYIDWSSQELAIAARLSGDAAMLETYNAADPYIAFARLAGAVPADATKRTHPHERARFKTCLLGTLYGLGEEGLARKIGQSTAHARELLQLHHETYPRFWQWQRGMIDHALLFGYIETCFGWRVHAEPGANARSLGNFPMQAHGAEMLRIACCLATEQGIRIAAPIHDALLVEDSTDRIEGTVSRTQELMAQASEIVLDGFRLRSDAEIIRYPDRFVDEDRGRRMWDTVMGVLADLTTRNGVTGFDTQHVKPWTETCNVV